MNGRAGKAITIGVAAVAVATAGCGGDSSGEPVDTGGPVPARERVDPDGLSKPVSACIEKAGLEVDDRVEFVLPAVPAAVRLNVTTSPGRVGIVVAVLRRPKEAERLEKRIANSAGLYKTEVIENTVYGLVTGFKPPAKQDEAIRGCLPSG